MYMIITPRPELFIIQWQTFEEICESRILVLDVLFRKSDLSGLNQSFTLLLA